ncbi:MAG TPA: sigma factor-like helix-turn-helix DNA-binding protein, partial [Anaerolineales bacterium]|nr:sigma factor-like helix-turn-helix DNA-binding protein [Anaerolineales bacterium]
NKDETLRDDYRRIDPPRAENAENTEMAYRVQNSTRGDLDLLRAIIERYAGDLYRWVTVYLFYLRGIDPSNEEVDVIIQKVFAYAILHTDQFHGQASVFNWLVAISDQIIRRIKFKDRFVQEIREIKHGRDLAHESWVISWASLKEISENQRTPLVLRYLLNLDLADIANILNSPVREVYRRLEQGRKHFLIVSSDPSMDHLLQGYVDGLYDDDPKNINEIEQHIETCGDCQVYLIQIKDFEKSLTESLTDHWPRKPFSQEECDELAQRVLVRAQLVEHGWKVKVNIRQAAWIVGILAVFGVFAIVFVRMTPYEKEFPQAAPTSTPQLAPIIEMEPVLVNAPSQNNSSTAPQYIEQALSSNGKWAVFAYISADLNTRQLALPDITIYDRENDTLQVISENTTNMNISWVWSELVPSISGDGQRVAYVSSTNNPGINGYPCDTQVHQPCLDIFLYDQSDKSTRRITQAVYGGAADGDSFAPTISEDGNWVAFWSAADNLVDVNKDICQSSERGINCLYIYLYNAQTGELQQIPIRNQVLQEISEVDRISLSADGRYVGFTLLSSALTSGISPEMPEISGSLQYIIPDSTTKPSMPFINQSSEAVVFDRQTGIYELENVTPDGMLGNGPSSSPVLSTDGRYVAFVSFASNLIGGDYNYAADVFVRDRQSGAIEIVSVSTHGRQGNNNSGVVTSMRGFYDINISSDGRYVVFQSVADNLGQDVQNGCRSLGIESCSNLYVHDLMTHETDSIVLDTNQGFSFFPGISADGRWVSFSQYSFNCTPIQFVCSNVMLYDRQSNWLKNITNFSQKISNLPWMYFTSLALPWQTWESRGLAFSPDGSYMAVGGFDSKIRIWHLLAGIRT